MFKTKTTIILGASASAELGLPVGEGLMSQIKELILAEDSRQYGFANDLLSRAVQQKVGSQPGFHLDGGSIASQRWRDAARKIRSGLDYHQSIDNLLHFLKDDEDAKALGKLAIATCILEDEKQSYFFHEVKNPIVEKYTLVAHTKGIRDSWYLPLGRKLISEHES